MSHVAKVVSLAVTILLSAGGIALAVDPSKVPSPATKQPPTPMYQKQTFHVWFELPTQNAKIVAGTDFTVKLKAITPPPAVYLLWEHQASGSVWWPQRGPTGGPWGGSSELEISFPQWGTWELVPGTYRVRAGWYEKIYSDWRYFQIVPK